MFFPLGLQHHVVPNIEAIILFYLIIFVFLLVMIRLLSLLTCIPSQRQRERQKAILYFRMPHNILFALQIKHKPLFSNAPGTASSLGALFFAWFCIQEASAKREWLVTKRKWPWGGYRREAKLVFLLPALLCAQIFIEKETSGYKAASGSWVLHFPKSIWRQ